AAAMWRAVTDAVGVEARDALWAHPDILPTAEDLDDPSALIARLSGAESAGSAADDEFDQALEQLLRGETPAAPGEDGEEPKSSN
ncbi:MAG TPA: zinc-dependent metalloprotease, partial [Agromyces sp.]